MQYWNGTAWVNVAPGTNGQTLTFCHGVPTWGQCNPAIPDVSTTAIISITTTAASTGGNVTYDGESTVSVRGACYNTNTGPTTANNPTPNGSGTGIFVSNLTGLTSNTTYYLKAYAINSTGTAYGDEVSFTTLAITIPILAATTAATSITAASANSGGTVTSDGGASISARGVCWSTSSGPIATGSHTTDAATATFTSSLTGLTASTKYYVRAYATNVQELLTVPRFLSRPHYRQAERLTIMLAIHITMLPLAPKHGWLKTSKPPNTATARQLPM